MIWFLLFVAAVLIMGPLRRPFFRNWRFNVPATASALAIWFAASALRKPCPPWWLVAPFALGGGLIAGRMVKEWFDEVFGKGN